MYAACGFNCRFGSHGFIRPYPPLRFALGHDWHLDGLHQGPSRLGWPHYQDGGGDGDDRNDEDSEQGSWLRKLNPTMPSATTTSGPVLGRE